ncbi:MAG: Zn-dependent alcohol dehydrogenase [Alphaproteobacteria bacterium]|nr:Zn-dependent alcohol dehydrogenase [Alphaproteobacteria bacterium]
MKAAVLFKVNEPLQVVDVELDPPKAGEVRVKMKAAGVCQSDWHIMNGDWPSPLPLVPGHEAAGVIEEVGAGVSAVKPGDHVIFSFRPQCGQCRYCTTGRPVLCIGRNSSPGAALFDGTLRLKHKGTGVYQMARIGTFAEHVVVPAEMVVPVRKDMPWPQAALVGCCVATGVGAVTRHAKIEAGSTVLVIGCGGVGLNIVQGALLSGARKIIACDLRDNKLEMARKFGATDTINSGGEKVVERIKELTGGLGVDYAFDSVSIDKTQALAIDAICPGGRAVTVGVPAVSMRATYSPFMMVFGEKVISGTFYGSVRPSVDFPILVEHYMNKRLNLDGLISRTYTLDQINDGFKAMMAGEVARGVVVFD